MYREHAVGGAECFAPEGSLSRIACAARFSRDRLGEKPLLYASRDGEIAVGRTYEELFAGGVLKKWRTEALVDFLATGTCVFPGGKTFFEGVFEVPPGHDLIVSEGQASVVERETLPEATAAQGVANTLRVHSERTQRPTELIHCFPSFSRILGNVEALMESDYAGMCSIRVNVDKRNAEGFLALREELLVRFRGKNISVSPAQVDVMGGSTCDGGCRMDTEEWTGFGLELARRHGVLPAWGLHPLDQEPLCVAGSSRSSSRYGFDSPRFLSTTSRKVFRSPEKRTKRPPAGNASAKFTRLSKEKSSLG